MKKFSTLVVASAVTGVALKDGLTISEMHQAIEHILGHPVWTHELPAYGRRADQVVRAKWPRLPTAEEAESDFVGAAAKAVAAYGDEMSIERGREVRGADPITSLAQMMMRPQ